MTWVAASFVSGCIVGGLLGLLGREILTLIRQIAQLERHAALRRTPPRRHNERCP